MSSAESRAGDEALMWCCTVERNRWNRSWWTDCLLESERHLRNEKRSFKSSFADIFFEQTQQLNHKLFTFLICWVLFFLPVSSSSLQNIYLKCITLHFKGDIFYLNFLIRLFAFIFICSHFNVFIFSFISISTIFFHSSIIQTDVNF